MPDKKILTDDVLFRLVDIFHSQGWTIEEENAFGVFNRFCSRLSELDSDEDRQFILDLTSDYLKVNVGEYEMLLLQSLRNYIAKEEIKKDATLHIMPMKNYDMDDKKTKSGNFLCYIITSLTFSGQDLFFYGRIRVLETKEALQIHKDEVSHLILVDDFIGSGETAVGSVESVKQYVDAQKISVVAIVAQRQGIEKINKTEENVGVYATIIREKGISDRYQSDEVEDRLAQMKKIERRIGVKQKYSLGYKHTESLVSMVKTPNNTFPFYWNENEKKGKIAPFPRRGNVAMDV